MLLVMVFFACCLSFSKSSAAISIQGAIYSLNVPYAFSAGSCRFDHFSATSRRF